MRCPSRLVVALLAGSVLVAGLTACRDQGTDPGGGAGRGEDEPALRADSAPVAVDCGGGSSRCPAVVVEGDPAATLASGAPAPLRGFSDPAIRSDPAGEALWMAYSWPSVAVAADGTRGTQVETHLARSEDGGGSWQAAGVLWGAQPTTDPASGAPGTTDHEVPALLPLQDDEGGTRWVGARLDLFAPAGGGLGQRPPSSFRIEVLTAPDPLALADGESVTLGAAATHPGWGVDVDLTTLGDDLDRCTVWNEPALHAGSTRLYLALRCLPLGTAGGPAPEHGSIEVFSTDAEGPVTGWEWRHDGQLAGHDEAVELGGEGLTQLELAEGRDGSLLALVTPDRWDPELGEFVHLGLWVLEADLTAPGLARDEDGRLVVRAVVTASDLDPFGPGAGAYDPAAETGVVLMRRVIGQGSLVASLHATGVQP